MTVGYALLLLILNVVIPIAVLYWLARFNNIIEYPNDTE